MQDQESKKLVMEDYLDRRVWYQCGGSSAYVRFHQKLLRESVSKAADGFGADELRRAALARLQNGDPSVVEPALSVLFVIGSSEDIELVDPLTKHPDESVRKAARTCVFELRKNAR